MIVYYEKRKSEIVKKTKISKPKIFKKDKFLEFVF